MAKINSRAKGAKNERDLSKLFEVWTKKQFSRTPSSGGLQWGAAMAKGDIVCTTEGHYFPFCIEAKAHREIDFSHLLNPKIKNCKVFEFWKQCIGDAKRANKIPLLLMRYNMMPKNFHFIAISNYFYIKIAHLYTTTPKLEYFSLGPNSFTIMGSTDFFRGNYKEIKLIAKKYLKDEKTKGG